MTAPAVSLIIPTHDEGLDVIATVDSILRHSPMAQTQLIVVDDGSSDCSVAALRAFAATGQIQLLRGEGLGAIRARNWGADVARAPLLGFIDAHCHAPPNWLDSLLETLDRRPDISALSPAIGCTKRLHARGYGGTWIDDELIMHWLGPRAEVTPVPFIGGAGTFVRRKVFDALGGFDEGLGRWGCEDVEFSLRIWLAGHTVAVDPNSCIYHKFRTHCRYGLTSGQYLYNKLRMIFLHFDGGRLRRLLRHHLQYPGGEQALERLYHDGAVVRREQLRRARLLSADAFCDRFGLVN